MGNNCTARNYKYHTTSLSNINDLNKLLNRTNLEHENHDIFFHESLLLNDAFCHNLFVFLSCVEHFEVFIYIGESKPISLKTKTCAYKIASFSNGNVYFRRVHRNVIDSENEIQFYETIVVSKS
jgi:hypothetical protein